jgi:hypothetical protein
MLWQLAQMLWVGGLWLLHIGLLPVLGRIGLAPLLIDEIAGMLNALMVGFAAACVVFQALVLVQADGLGSLWRDIRGQLLLMALYACAMYLCSAYRLAGCRALAGVQLSCSGFFRAGAGIAAGAWMEWQGARSTPVTLVIT